MFDNACGPGYCIETLVSKAFVGRVILRRGLRGKLQQLAMEVFFWTIFVLSLLVTIQYFFVSPVFLFCFLFSRRRAQSWLG